MVIVPLVILGACLLGCLIECSKTNLKLFNLVAKAKKVVFYGLFLRMMIVTYLSMVVASGIGRLFKLDYFEGTNVVLLIYISAVIQFTGYFLYYMEPNELEISSTKQKFGSLYQELRTKHFETCAHTPLFFIRRVTYVYALQTSVFSLKYGGVIFCSMGTLSYLLHYRP